MKLPILHSLPDRRLTGARAFTLIEMMVTAGLLGFIVLGLTSMFVHTQRAFRAGVTQTDVLESGRAAMDLMTRELESTTPSRIPTVTNFYTRYSTYSENTLVGSLSTPHRINVVQGFYSLTEFNHRWTGIGYLVAIPSADVSAVGVGSLYRFQYTFDNPGANLPAVLADYSAQFHNIAVAAVRNYILPTGYYQGNDQNISTNLTRVCDGVIGLRLVGYDENGLLLSDTNGAQNMLISRVPISPETRDNFPVPDFPVAPSVNTNTFNGLGVYEFTCTNNAVPVTLELELSILESQVYDRFKGIPNTSAQAAYLGRQAGAIHVFRRRVALHNVDLEAYK